jgi:predicted nuclease with TOPRIM domain
MVNPDATYTHDMDIQETIDSLRKLLEGVIAPGVEFLRLRLDALEKDLRETGQSFDRLDKRVDHLAERMEDGFARMGTRMDHLEHEVQALRK